MLCDIKQCHHKHEFYQKNRISFLVIELLNEIEQQKKYISVFFL